MDIGRAAGYPFKDPNWIVKILIGTVVSLIPIVNFIGFGYVIRTIRQVSAGNESTLPEWDDWGNDFIRGLYMVIAYFIYTLPIMIVYCCTAILATIIGGDDGAGGLLFLCIMPFILIYGILLIPLVGVGVIRYAESDNFTDAFFNFGAILATIQNNSAQTLMFILWAIVIQLVVGTLASLLFWVCGLGLAVAWAGYLMIAHLSAQYGQSIGLLGKFKNSAV